MPASESNKNFKHNQVIRYEGKNFQYVYNAMAAAKERKSMEPLKI